MGKGESEQKREKSKKKIRYNEKRERKVKKIEERQIL